MYNSVITQQKAILQSLIDEHTEIGIIVGEIQDIDKMAASLALYLSLLSSGKKVQIVSKKEPIVELSNLVGVDKIKRNFDGSVKLLTISVPNENDEIVKISYTTEASRVNLNLFAAEDGTLSMNERDISFIKKGSSPELLFVVGISSFEEIEDLIDSNTRPKIINVDNNALNTLFGDVVLSDPEFSSLSEVVAQIINSCFLPLDNDTAQNLIDGISFATGNFSSPKTSAHAFEGAAMLLRVGAKRREGQKIAPHFSTRGGVASNTYLDDGLGVSKPSFQRGQDVPKINRKQDLQQNTDENLSPYPASSSRPLTGGNNGNSSEDVPSDWFMPKVFKGSKKQE